MIDLKEENARLAEENKEVREMNLLLAKKLEECGAERDEHYTKLEEMKLILADAVTCMNYAVQDLGTANRLIVKTRGGKNTVGVASPGAHLDLTLTPSVGVVGDCIKTLDEIVASVSQNSEATYDALLLSPQGLLSNSEVHKALQSKLVRQKSKLERCSWLEMENGRLQRILKSRRGSDIVDRRDAVCQVELSFMTSPMRGGRVTGSKPTIVQMPGVSDYNVNAELWPIRSVGTQCTLLQQQELPPEPQSHHSAAASHHYDAFVNRMSRVAAMTPTRFSEPRASLSPSPSARRGKAIPKRNSNSPSPSVRRFGPPTLLSPKK